MQMSQGAVRALSLCGKGFDDKIVIISHAAECETLQQLGGVP